MGSGGLSGEDIHTAMVEIFYRYRIHPSQARAFEHAMGHEGPWALLYATHPRYIRSRLFRHRGDVEIYLTVDVWEEKADWDDFRSEHAGDLREIERRFGLLYLERHLLGYFEGDEEYRAPLDAFA